MSAAYDLYQQGRTHLRSGMPAQATVALEKAKRLEPEKASIREALGIAYFRLSRWSEAEEEFRKVLELSPADDYAHYALGRASRNQGRHDEARGHLKLARSLRPRGNDELGLDLDEPDLGLEVGDDRRVAPEAPRGRRRRTRHGTSPPRRSSSVRAYVSRSASSRSAIASTTSWKSP